MMKAKHAPKLTAQYCGECIQILDETGRVYATINHGGNWRNELRPSEADMTRAKTIIRSVNSHDSLVDALKGIMPLLDSDMNAVGPWGDEADACRAALKQAGA